MIVCQNVSVRYGKREVISSLSLALEEGKITVLLGKNGCGKATLLRAISGGVRYSGSIAADGCEISQMKPPARAQKIAVMPQMLKSPGITVRELVSFGRQPYTGFSGVLSETDRLKVEAVLQKTGLLPLADATLDRISGGERQKAYFAMLLAQETAHLLLDEPGSHLDNVGMQSLCDFLLQEKEEGKMILAVLHDLNRAVELADRIAILDGGSLIFSGTPASFSESDLPERIFRVRKVFLPDGSVFFR